MSRKNARETLYKLIFEYLFSKERNDQTMELLLLDATLTEDDKNYIVEGYRGISENIDELTALVMKYATGYSSPDRLVKGDLTAMLISSYELTHCSDIPAGVSINEAVDLVKRFSTSKSSGFVNGVLASINKEVRKDGEDH